MKAGRASRLVVSCRTKSPTAPLATIASLAQHEGQTVTLRGWLYNIRSSGKLLFPAFRDGTGTIQGIVPKAAVSEEVFNTLKSLTLESSLTVTGKVRADSRAPSGYELDVENIEVLQRVPEGDAFPYYSQGARRRFSDGASSPVAPYAAPVFDSACARDDHAGSG